MLLFYFCHWKCLTATRMLECGAKEERSSSEKRGCGKKEITVSPQFLFATFPNLHIFIFSNRTEDFRNRNRLFVVGGKVYFFSSWWHLWLLRLHTVYTGFVEKTPRLWPIFESKENVTRSILIWKSDVKRTLWKWISEQFCKLALPEKRLSWSK